MSKVAVIAKLTLEEGRFDDFLEVMGPMFAQVTENEPGTELYMMHRDAADANVVWFYELYTDDVGFQAHASSTPIQQLFAATGDMMTKPMELHMCVPVKAVSGMP